MESTSQQTEQMIFPPFLEENELSKWLLQPKKDQQSEGCFTFQVFLPDTDPEIWLADNTGSYIDSQLPLLPSYGTTPEQASTVDWDSLLKTMDVISHSPNDEWLMCVRFDYFQQISEQDNNEWLLSPSQQQVRSSPSQHLVKSQEQEEEMEDEETISRLQDANQNTKRQKTIQGHQSTQAGMKKAPLVKRGREKPVSQSKFQNTIGSKRTRKK